MGSLKGIKSIAQWQATKGSGALGNRGEGDGALKGLKSYSGGDL